MENHYKKELGFHPDDFLICTFGFVVATKNIENIIKNIKDFLEKTPNCKYIIVGDIEDRYAVKIQKLVTDLKLTDKIIFKGFVNDSDYSKFLKICNVAIQLRKNIRAGGSGTINRALGAGIPTIITDAGPFRELPDNAVIKIKPENENMLGNTLEKLYSDNDYRKQIADSARIYAQSSLSIDSCSEKYMNIIANLSEEK